MKDKNQCHFCNSSVNGNNQIIHTYDAAGNRLRTSYYTRKVTTTVPLGNTLPVGTAANYHITRDVFHHNVVYHADNATGTNYGIKYVNNLEGHIRYLGQEEHYHFYYVKDHLGNIRETYAHTASNHRDCIQRMQYYPSGLPWNANSIANEQPYKYGGKEFVEMHGLDEYDSHARWYYPALARTTTMDPHSEDYYPISPYAWCGNNFVNAIDPTGMDWYSDSNDSTIIRWTDFSSQKEMDKNGIAGKYIGEAYVVFNGSRNERLGKGENLYGEGAILADVKVYGPSGQDNIQYYKGFTMSSDFQYFGAIADDTYTVNYQKYGKSGALKSHWAINDGGPVNCIGGVNPSPINPYSPTQKNAIYIHSSNGNGSAGVFYDANGKICGAVSTGCLLIAPSSKGHIGWSEFNQQLLGVEKFVLRLQRR